MMRSITFLQKFLENGTLGRMIKWVDEHYDNAWSKSLDACQKSIAGAKDFDEMHAIDESLTARQMELSALYTESEEYQTALEIEAAYHLCDQEDKPQLDPLGVIIHHIVKDKNFRERYYQ